MSSFIQRRNEMLFDTMPCDRILYRDNDKEELYQALKITMEQIKEKCKALIIQASYILNLTLLKMI